jgi:hypothetical protein
MSKLAIEITEGGAGKGKETKQGDSAVVSGELLHTLAPEPNEFENADILREPQIEFGVEDLDQAITTLFNHEIGPDDDNSLYTAQGQFLLRKPVEKGMLRIAFTNDRGSVDAQMACNAGGLLRRKNKYGQGANAFESETLGYNFSVSLKLLGCHEARKYILNVGANEVALGSVDGKDFVFLSGTHLIESPRFELNGVDIEACINTNREELNNAFSSTAENHISHGTAHYVQVPPGKFSMAVVDNQPLVLPSKKERYAFRSTISFELKQNEDSSTLFSYDAPFVQAGNMTRLFVPRAKIATLTINGEPQLLQGSGTATLLGGDGKYVDFQAKSDSEPFYDINDEVIAVGNILRLRIPANHIATILKDGVAELIVGTGRVHDLGGTGEPAQLVWKKEGVTPFYSINDPIIQLNNRLRLQIPADKILPCVIDGEPYYLTAADNAKHDNIKMGSFSYKEQEDGSPFLPFTTPQHQNGVKTWLNLEPTKKVVVNREGKMMELEHDNKLPTGVYIVDSRIQQLVRVVDMRQRELRIPSEAKIEEHRQSNSEAVEYHVFNSQENVHIGVKGFVLYKPTDAVQLATTLKGHVVDRVEDVVVGDLAAIMSRTSYMNFANTGQKSSSGEQGWQSTLDTEARQDLEKNGISLDSFRVLGLKILDPAIEEHLSKQADVSIQQAAQLNMQSTTSELALVRAALEQKLALQAQTALNIRNQEQQAAANQMKQEQLTAQIRLQSGELEAELNAAKMQCEIAKLKKEAAEHNATAGQAEQMAQAAVLQKFPVYLQLQLAKIKAEAMVQTYQGMTVNAGTPDLDTMQRMFSSAAQAGNPMNFASLFTQSALQARSQARAEAAREQAQNDGSQSQLLGLGGACKE